MELLPKGGLAELGLRVKQQRAQMKQPSHPKRAAGDDLRKQEIKLPVGCLAREQLDWRGKIFNE